MTPFGLGAVQSPPDARDYVLAIPNALTLPPRFTLTRLGPILDQGMTGTCVAHAADGIRLWQERRDGSNIAPWLPEDAVLALYDRCKALDGDPDPERAKGTSLRSVLSVLKNYGTPLVAPHRNGGRISAYYGVPLDVATMKQALMQHGPLLVACAWDAAWFVPKRLVLPAPSGKVAGGHAFFIWGWDDSVNGGAWLMRNSWGRAPGWPYGSAYMAFRYLTDAARWYEAWWLQDILHDPIK